VTKVIHKYPIEVNVFKRTTDDWYGSYRLDNTDNGMLVEVGFANLDGLFRVSVWGTDDCGMEFDRESENEAWNIFLGVIGMENVNRKELIDLGFVSGFSVFNFHFIHRFEMVFDQDPATLP